MGQKNIKTTRLKVRAYKAVGTIVPIIFLFYLVLYLKETGLTTQSYFANYDNAIVVWSVGLQYFRTIMNTIDSVVKALGKFIDFIVDFAERIVNWVKELVEKAGGSFTKSVFDRLVSWARNVIGNLMF
jgi:hypothetical protein